MQTVSIYLLDEQTINQIAAGEVVESPASVLKELVENAVDAGATCIEIEALAGGLECLRISDNGKGMSAEDLEKCILRHATSKLRSIGDLTGIQTMGFRGEALAAIAAVSHLKIQTCSTLDLQGGAWQIEVRAGVASTISPCARSQGTTVEVRDLFFNVPARKVFQKGPSASASELTRLIGSLALAYPHVQWIYKHGTRTVLQWPSSSDSSLALCLDRCRLVLGENFATSACSIDAKRMGWQLKGWLGHASEHRPSRQGQYWIINRRLVQAPQLGYFVQEGYGTRLPAGRFSSFALHLELPGDWVDVNVHPQKKEVRIKDPGWLGGWIAHQVHLALSGLQLEPDFVQQPSIQDLKNQALSFDPFSIENLSASSKENEANALSGEVNSDNSFSKASVSGDAFQLPAYQGPIYSSSNLSSGSFFKNEGSDLGPQVSHFGRKIVTSAPAFDFELRPLAVWKRFSLWPVEELRKRLPSWDKEIASGPQPWVLAWMSASRAQARLRFEQIAAYSEEVLAHALLLPLRLEWRVDELDRLLRNQQLLKDLGIEVTPLDRENLAVHTLPVGLEESQVKSLLQQILELGEKARSLGSENKGLLLARFIESAEASHPSGYGNAGDTAPSDLILGLSNCPQPFYSPTGKPIFKPLALGDLEVKGRRGDSG